MKFISVSFGNKILKGKIYGLKIGQKYHPITTFKSQYNSSTDHNQTFCSGEDFVLLEWNCYDNSTISSISVCDGKTDCPEGSDEATLLCHGNAKWRLYIFLVILAWIFVGFFSYLPGKK